MSASEDKPQTAAEKSPESSAETAEAEPGNEPDERGAAPAEEPRTRDPEALLDALEAARGELAETRDDFLRAKAEAENVRRRSEQEIARVRKFAVEAFAAELLTVKDSLDLAADVELGDRADDRVKGMHEGLALTRRQLDAVFEKFGIVAVEPQPGDRLNPELHQAMSMEESDAIEPNRVARVVQKGFTLNERLLRAAMVIVAKAPAA